LLAFVVKDFAADAHERLRALIVSCAEIDRGAESARRVLVLQDSTTGVQVVLEPDLPSQASQQLLRFDLTTIHRGPLHYDRHRRQWRSELDETATSSATQA
jgi:hypothetical protein